MLFSDLGFDTFQQYCFPSIVNVCVLRGQCNCSCVHCPVGKVPKHRRGDVFGDNVMSMRLYKKIVDESALFEASVLRIHAVGEPLLWSRIKEAMAYASKKGVKLWLFTSLLFENTSLLESVAQHCAIVEVSVNSTDREDYIRTKGTDGFNMVVKNLCTLSSVIASIGASTRLIVSRVESGSSDQDNVFIRYWEKYGVVDDVFVRSYHDYNSAIEKKNNTGGVAGTACLVHWNRFNIDTDGSAVVCFNELFKGNHVDRRLVYGNVTHESIAEIWKGEKINRIRLAQLSQDYSIVDFTDNLPCKVCSSCQPLDGERKTSEYQIKKLAERH